MNEELMENGDGETVQDDGQITAVIRPTKKQRELLNFIEIFIAEHGYSPSYREIMKGLNYTSVATVALHVNNLLKRGHLRKRDRSARSLEVVNPSVAMANPVTTVVAKEEKWLVEKVHHFLKALEAEAQPVPAKLDEVYVLLGALHVLGMDGAVMSFMPRLQILKKRTETT
jgi:hypothetical protein